MIPRLVLFLILGIDSSILLFQTSELSISYYEASILYGEFSVLQYLIKTSLYFFGHNDFALRLPMIILHLLSVVILYKISKLYIKLQRNRLWLTFIFVLLPGIISSALIIDNTGLLLFGLFFFVYIYQKNLKLFLYPLLFIYLLVDTGFLFLFLALSLFSIKEKDKNFFIFNIILFFTSLYLYGVDAHGTPQGHLIDSIGIYATIFTPIIFIYIFYILYRKYLNKDTEILWYISSTALIVSLFLSFRQRIYLEHFAPYLMLALPIMAQVFEHSYRVRLKMFRNKYRIIFIITISFLLINSSFVFFNKYLYLVVDNPKKHFAYKMHVAKELASKLNDMGINCIHSDIKMSNRLKFYNIGNCNSYILIENNLDYLNEKTVTISYKNRLVYQATVTKLNIN
ncbi:MAG: hypothetical protein COB17_10700 [Sulfurimonas sp.]|nr:MAG: hypothetical protein COB17_10700 [Sulfurimonas sp.]